MSDFFTNKYVMKGAIQGDKPADPYCDYAGNGVSR
jgi:hypothetical protein